MTVAYQDGKVDHERMLAEAREQAVARAAAKVGPEAHRIGAIALVEPGYEVYSRSRRHAADDMQVGGVVLEVEHGMDPETGESTRTFIVISSRPDHGRPFTVRKVKEEDIGEADVQLPNTSTLKGIGARLNEAAAQAKRKRGPLLPEVVDWDKWALLLSALVVHGARRG